MRTLTGKHKIWGENWLYLRPYLKAFPVFNVLKTVREYFLTIDLGIVEFVKKFIEWFLEKCEIFRHGPNYVQKRKRSHRISLNLAIMEAIMAGTYPLKRFLQKTPGTEKHKDN